MIAHLLDCFKDILPKPFLTDRSIVALDIRVLLRLAWLDVNKRDTMLLRNPSVSAAGVTVLEGTYQSIQVISDAQKNHGLPVPAGFRICVKGSEHLSVTHAIIEAGMVEFRIAKSSIWPHFLEACHLRSEHASIK